MYAKLDQDFAGNITLDYVTLRKQHRVHAHYYGAKHNLSIYVTGVLMLVRFPSDKEDDAGRPYLQVEQSDTHADLVGALIPAKHFEVLKSSALRASIVEKLANDELEYISSLAPKF